MAGRNNSFKKSGVNSVETLAEVFRCFICMEKLQDAHLCPHCSKLCCYACIRRWLTEQRSQCPHCRATLLLFELVNCRWVEEVTQNLDTLRAAGADTSSSGGTNSDAKNASERCPDHPSEQLTVFCETCTKCICHRCALWGGTTHAGHSFKPIAEVHEHHVQRIKSEISELQQRRMKLSNVMLKVEHRIDVVRAARDDKANEVYRTVESMISRLDAQLKSNISTLTGRRGLLGQETEKLEAIINDVEHKLATCSRSDLIRQSSDLSEFIKIGQSRPLTHLVAAPVLGEFKSEIVPPYDSGTFVIQNFTRFQGKGEALYSPPLHVHGLCWRLKVYPNGNGVVRGLYLSIFLELTAGLPESSKYEYRIEMIHQATRDHQRSIVREFASDFEVGECWGYNRFFRLDLLSREGYMASTNGTLELKFQVRAPTYFLKCRDQEWYINQLQALESQYSAQISELKEKREKDRVSISGSLDEPNDVSGPMYPRHQKLESRSAVENQMCIEEPIRESSAYSNFESSAKSNNACSTNSGASITLATEIFDSLEESDSDLQIISQEASDDESDDERINLPVTPGQIRVVEGTTNQGLNISDDVRMSRFVSFVSSTPKPSAATRFSIACNHLHPSHFRRLSRAHDEVGVASHQPTSDGGDDLNHINLHSSDSVSVEAIAANLSNFTEPLNQTVNTEADIQDSNNIQMIQTRLVVLEDPGREGSGFQSKFLEELVNLQLSPPFSSSHHRSAPPSIDTLSTSLCEILNESSPRTPPIPHQRSHRILPSGNSSQSRASNQQTPFPTNQGGRSSLVGQENIDSISTSDEA